MRKILITAVSIILFLYILFPIKKIDLTICSHVESILLKSINVIRIKEDCIIVNGFYLDNIHFTKSSNHLYLTNEQYRELLNYLDDRELEYIFLSQSIVLTDDNTSYYVASVPLNFEETCFMIDNIKIKHKTYAKFNGVLNIKVNDVNEYVEDLRTLSYDVIRYTNE